MFKRPTTRRRTNPEPEELNLVPLLDALVVLIVFLLYSFSFIAIVGIESPAPVASTQDLRQKIDKRPLQLTLTMRDEQVEIWSPFDRIKSRKIEFSEPGIPDFNAIHEELITIKEKFPLETKIVIVPTPALTYDILIATLDSVRYLTDTDPVFYIVNQKSGIEEESNALFPQVIFGNLLGSAS